MMKSVCVLFLCIYVVSALELSINVRYPIDTEAIYLRGDGCGLNWNQGVGLHQIGTNLFQLNVTCSSEQELQVKAVMKDVDYQIGGNEIIELSDAKDSYYVTFFPWFYSKAGAYSVMVKNMHSPELGNDRDVIVYLPPSYQENTEKTYDQVLIMHDGQNLFNPRTSAFGTAWMCQDTVDGMVVAGEMDEIIIVGLYNTADRENEYTYSYDPSEQCGGKGDLYLDFIENEVIPWINGDSNLRVETGSNHLGILGSSLGGLISCYAGWTRPQTYQKMGCMSSSFWWNNKDFNGDILVNRSDPIPSLNAIYLDSGGAKLGDGDDYQETIDVRDHMSNSFGYIIDQNLFYYWDKNGQHSEQYWGDRFHVPMGEMYPFSTLTPKAPANCI